MGRWIGGMRGCRALCASAGLVVAVAASGGEDAGSDRPVIAAELFETDAGSDFRARAAVPSKAERRRAVIEVHGLMSDGVRARLAEAGVRLGDSFGIGRYEADLSKADWRTVRGLADVSWIGAAPRSARVDPGLLQAAGPDGRVEVVAHLFMGEPLGDTVDALNALPGVSVRATVLEGRRRVVVLSADAGSIDRVLDLGGVRWLERTPKLTLRNKSVRWISQTNIENETPLHDAGVIGSGEIIGLIDREVRRSHCSFSDPENDPPGPLHRKIAAYNAPSRADVHGTHVAGILLGDAGLDDDARGLAYGARLAYSPIPTYTDAAGHSIDGVRQTIELHASQGAFVHSNSWGDDLRIGYTGVCRTLDEFLWMNDEHVVVFAASNQSTLRTPENAKNVIAVGATQMAPLQHEFCSGGTGPTLDGRRKPDLTAPGCSVRSAYAFGAGCPTNFLSGTSMAAPVVAGSAAMVRQYFKDGFYPSGAANSADAFTPLGPLVKAVLVGATDGGLSYDAFPGDQGGWGRLRLSDSLPLAGDARRLKIRQVPNNAAGALNTGDVYHMTFRCVDRREPLRVTLAFYDAPGAFGASNPVVNDLDLTLIGPTGTPVGGSSETGLATYYGNDFAGGESRGVTASGIADPINSVEQVAFSVPVEGDYTLIVSAREVAVGSQGYAVVVSGAVRDVPEFGFDFAEPYDGVVGLNDQIAFIEGIERGSELSDLNGDGRVDFFDVLSWDALVGAGFD